MGQALSTIIEAFNCNCMYCSKYVCNACDFRSECCNGDLCGIEYHTEAIDLSRDDSDYEIEIDNCCLARKSN